MPLLLDLANALKQSKQSFVDSRRLAEKKQAAQTLLKDHDAAIERVTTLIDRYNEPVRVGIVGV